MKNYQFILGIDVSKKTLDLCLILTDHPLEKKTFNTTNTIKGYQSIVNWLKKLKLDLGSGLVVLEHTGIYSLVLCEFLDQQQFSYSLVSGLEVKRSSGISRGKDDKKDAYMLAIYGYRHREELKPNMTRQAELLQLQMLQAQRKRLVNTKKTLLLPVKELHEMNMEDKARTLEGNQLNIIEQINDSIKAIEKQIMDIIQKNEQLKKQYELCTSIPGVGMQLAVYLLVTTGAFTLFKNSRKLACFAGVAPFAYQSGTSIRGRNKVSHLADKELKSLLHMASLNAVRADNQLKLYYQRKKAEGKNALLVLNTVRNKLLQRIMAVVDRGTPYVQLAQHLT
jgi:transposase